MNFSMEDYLGLLPKTQSFQLPRFLSQNYALLNVNSSPCTFRTKNFTVTVTWNSDSLTVSLIDYHKCALPKRNFIVTFEIQKSMSDTVIASETQVTVKVKFVYLFKSSKVICQGDRNTSHSEIN